MGLTVAQRELFLFYVSALMGAEVYSTHSKGNIAIRCILHGETIVIETSFSYTQTRLMPSRSYKVLSHEMFRAIKT